MYGRNAVGGAVNFIAASPTDEMYAKVKLGVADFDQTSGEVVLSGPLTDSIGVRFAATHLDANEGWIKNQMPDNDDLMQGEQTNVRLIVTADLSDAVSAELMLGRSKQSGRWTHWAMIEENIPVWCCNFFTRGKRQRQPRG